jgi:hypothetical protein
VDLHSATSPNGIRVVLRTAGQDEILT